MPSLSKLYMSNNEIQGLGSLEQLETLTSLEAIQMEGNPVWSNQNYCSKLIVTLPALIKLDQQDITQDMKILAEKWKQSLVTSVQPEKKELKENQEEKSKLEIAKKEEMRKTSINNAMSRWKIIKNNTVNVEGDEMDEPKDGELEDEPSRYTPISISVRNERSKSRERTETKLEASLPSTDTLKPTASKSRPRRLSENSPGPVKRQLARSSSISSNISRVSVSDSESTIARSSITPAPPIPLKDISMKYKFPGLERRTFALPQRYETFSQSESPHKSAARRSSILDLELEKQKIGYFTERPKGEGGLVYNSDDEYSEEYMSTSDSTSDSDSSNEEKQSRHAYQDHTGKRLQDKHRITRGRNMSRNIASSRSSSQLSVERDRGHVRQWVNKHNSKTGALFRKRGDSDSSGRTCEQGEDYLIEIDGDTLSVYGSPSLQFIDRSWNKQKAEKTTTVQFHFVSFDDLVPRMQKFRENFPNVEHFEFTETNIRTINQVNALASMQGITSLTINKEGNPVYTKAWRQYAIYRLEHWGLLYINNKGVTDDEILAANDTYGSLGELAIMTLPKAKILSLLKKLELGDIKDMSCNEDFLASIKDGNIKEIIAKESLEYDPKKSGTLHKERAALRGMIDLGHSVFHKFGRLEDEWKSILPIVIHRILTQYQDIHSYKREELTKLETEVNTK